MRPAAAGKSRCFRATILSTWMTMEPCCVTMRVRRSTIRSLRPDMAASCRWSARGCRMPLQMKHLRLVVTVIRIATGIPPGGTVAAAKRTNCDEETRPGHPSLSADHPAYYSGRHHGPRPDRGSPNPAGESRSPAREESLSIDQQLSAGALSHFQPARCHGLLSVRPRDVRDGFDRRSNSRKGTCVSSAVAGISQTPRRHPRPGEPQKHHRPVGCVYAHRDGFERRFRRNTLRLLRPAVSRSGPSLVCHKGEDRPVVESNPVRSRRGRRLRCNAAAPSPPGAAALSHPPVYYSVTRRSSAHSNGAVLSQ